MNVQPKLRDDPPELRGQPGGASHASRTTSGLAVAVARTLLAATGVGLFLGFIGAFGLSGVPLLQRCLLMLPYSWVGGLLGLTCFRLLVRTRWGAGPTWRTAALAGLAMTGPMAVFVWGISWAISPPGIPLHAVPDMLLITLVMCVAMSLFAGFVRPRTILVTVPAEAPAPPRFLERLPLKLRGAELWAIQAEDHYLRLHTSKGQDLILLRLADAIDELTGIEGAQVHRSWWVARDAIVEARRGDGRATLTLKDGSEVPVSRTYARTLRQRNWI